MPGTGAPPLGSPVAGAGGQVSEIFCKSLMLLGLERCDGGASRREIDVHGDSATPYRKVVKGVVVVEVGHMVVAFDTGEAAERADGQGAGFDVFKWGHGRGLWKGM